LLKKREKDSRERWAKLGSGMEREEGIEGFGVFYSFFYSFSFNKQNKNNQNKCNTLTYLFNL
jgi:hypothetical protein